MRFIHQWFILPAFVAFIMALTSCFPVDAQDAASGRKMAAQVCQTCHGLDGLSRLPNAPHIAGAPEAYFVAQLEAYRSGMRQNEMMTLVAKSLTDADIANLAAWYGAIEVTVKAP